MYGKKMKKPMAKKKAKKEQTKVARAEHKVKKAKKAKGRMY